MKTKLFSLILALIVSVGTLSAWDYENVGIGNLIYNLDDTNLMAEVTNNSYSFTGDITIPASVTYKDKNYSVTSIGNSVFSLCSGLTSLTIPNSVTSIGANAFYNCSGLTEITIPNSVANIGYGAFYECSGLTSATIGNSVTNIGDKAFYRCTGMKTITIPNSVTNIGEEAFYLCENMTEINVETNNPNYCSENGVLFNKDKSSLIEYPCGKHGAYTIPNSVTNIRNYAFKGCFYLTEVAIPNSVTSIEDYAFAFCSGLTSVSIPNGVNIISVYAFYNCDNLTSIEIPNSVTGIGQDAFQGCNNMKEVTDFSTTPQIISSNVFRYLNLSALTLYVPASSLDLYKSANVWKDFGNIQAISGTESCLIASGTCGDNLTWELSCDSVLTISGTGEMGDVTWNDYKDQIKEVIIEDGVTSIASTAFYDCSNLSSVSIPNSVTRIGKFAFSNCPSLTSLTIPASVTQIEGHFVSSLNDSHYNIVMESPNITSLSVEAGNPVYDSRNNCNAIIETATNTLLAGCQNTIIPNTVTKIGYCAFYRCSALKSIDIPSSVTSIGAAAFNETGLTSVVLPHNVTIECEDSQAYWFLGAFGGCHELTNLSFADGEGGASVIGHNAFSNCDKLTEVTFPNNITSIGNYAFLRCNSITSIIIPSSVTNIGNTAFACDNLASLTCYAVTPPSAELYIANPSIPLYVPTESVEAYRNADVWKDFTNILPIGGSQEDPGHPTNPGTYQVTLNASIEGAGVLTGAGMYAEGAEVTISATANAGYTFTQWSDGVTSASRTITMIARDTTLTAEFSVNSYQLIYKVDGEEYKSESVAYGATITPITNPEKVGHTFSGWSEIPTTMPAHDVTITGTFTINKYTITFVDEDGTTVLKSSEVEYGATPTAPADPTKAATAQYTYTFAGWSPEIVAVTGEATYTATYNSEVNKYTITFVDEDGTTILKSSEVEYGATPTAPADPTKAATAQYTYTFAGWDKPIVAVTGAATYTATYSSTVNKYTITFVDEDGTTVLASNEVEYGAIPTAPANPTKAATAQYTYTFAGWDTPIVAVTGAATYTATYSSMVNKYTITFLDEDGTTVLASNEVEYGATPTAPADPTKAATAQYTYTFTGWDTPIVAVTGAATYTATYSSTVNKYTITFVDEDGTTVLASNEVEYGATPTAPADPTKAATAQYTYTFAGWDTPIVAVTGAATYTATYSSMVNKYTITFLDEDGTTVLASNEVEYGTMPTAPVDPTKAATAQYTFVFAGWSPEIAEVAGAATYTATYNSLLNNVAVTGEQDLAELPVGENTHITVSEAGNLSVSEPVTIGTITITVSGDEASQITGIDNLTVNNAEMILRLEPNKSSATPNKWYAFAVPFEVNVTGGIFAGESTTAAVCNSAFVFDEYDGALRASTQDGWKRVAASATLQPGVLYMFAPTGTTNEWRFVKRASARLTEAASLSVAAYPSTIGDHHAGWNGVANTLFRQANISLNGVEHITTYDNALSVYKVQPIDEVVLATAQPFFVQAPAAGTILFAEQPSNAAARYLHAANEDKPSCVLSLSSADYTDRAYLSAQIGKENVYTIGHDLVKMQTGTPSVPQLWFDGYNVRLAAYELPLTAASTTAIISLGLYAPVAGDYTLDATAPTDKYTLTLLYQGAPLAELGEQPYTVTLNQGDNSSYALRISKRTDVETAIENGQMNKAGTTKVLENGILYFLLPDGTRYSVMGTEVK